MNIKSKSFGNEVKDKLYYLDMTQTQLAKRLGITVQYLGDILKGHRKATEIRLKIVQILEQEEKRLPKECAVNDH